MKPPLIRLAAVVVVLIAAALCSLSAGAEPMRAPPPREIIERLSLAVAAVAARTRPLHWPMRRACLYYAITGQALLAEQGIAAHLLVGRVVYWPGTAAEHAIDPHAWLETASEFVDYAMLPRSGRTAILPLEGVAALPSAVIPGVTRVLAIEAEPSNALHRYLSHHCRRFHRAQVDSEGVYKIR